MRSFLAILLLPVAGAAGARPPGPPNVVLILADDMGYSDLGCYGGEIPTPHLDALAAGGLRFTQFYSAARCCPTRAALLTGLYPHQAAIGHMVHDLGPPAYRGELTRRSVTLAEVLRPAGYRTYLAGKWHVSPSATAEQLAAHRGSWPRARGFDRFYGTIRGSGSFWDPSALVRDDTFVSPAADPEYRPAEYHYTDAISDHAERYVREHARDHPGRPFFLYVAHTAPHWPLHAREAAIARQRGRYDAGYDAIRGARWARQRELGLVPSASELTPPAEDWAQVRDRAFEIRCMEVYAAMITEMDAGIGRLVAALRETGQFENTLLLYLHDNGACAEYNGRRGSGPPRGAGPTLPPLPPETLQFENRPPQTRDGWPLRMGYGVLPGGADTFIAYGRGWANVSNTPFREFKHWVHEGGIASPLIVHWPAGLRPAMDGQGPAGGARCAEPAHVIDLMATCLAVSGAAYPAEFAGEPIPPTEGRSLVPLFTAPDRPLLPAPRPLFWEHEGHQAMRLGRWKLVRKYKRDWELYDLETDRTELRDLAGREPARVRAMAVAWQAWADRVGVVPWTHDIPEGGWGSPKSLLPAR